ncbi:MAG TPA: ABC transporter substrate-binding protein, partial [Gemmatimonadales bacterium]|nr:ABC transporter substrate-binding protein [Gemmatimonadales bacterium]
SGAAIDAEVRRLRDAGRPVIALEAAQIRKLRPDLIITQGLCEVCAVSDGEAYRLAEAIHPAPRVLALVARDLGGIWRDIHDVATALDLVDEAEELVAGLQSRLRGLRTIAVAPPPRVLCVEWLEPLYLAGHWVPELVAAAGGEDVGARAGSHSARRDWAELPALRPDHVVVMLCGLGTERARAELEALDQPEALALMGRVPTWILDGNQYASRPGPRVVDGAERMRAVLTGVPTGEVERWRPAVRC